MTAPQLRRALGKMTENRLSDSAAALLALLHEHGEITMTAAAEHIAASAAALTGLADRLETLGFAARRHGRHDRRQVILEITPRGCLTLEEILSAANSAPALI